MTLSAALSLTVSVLVMTSIWSWMVAAKKLVLGQPLLAYEPRQRPQWNVIDVLLTLIVWGLLQFLVIGLLTGLGLTNNAVPPTGDAESAAAFIDSAATRWAIVLSGVASLLTCVLAAWLIVLRTGARWGADLGLTLRYAGRDIATGFIAFAMLAPIVYTIQMILVQWYPSEHPLIVSFQTNPSLGLYLVCAFAAAIAAPIFEEFACRVILQGLLERIVDSKSMDEALFLSRAMPGAGLDVVPEDVDMPKDDAASESPAAEAEVNESAATPHAETTTTEPLNVAQRVLPILGSSLVFALLHWSHGPDPIPLFVLAIGLGYLYQRTHRILPCVVLHFLLNAFTLAVLALSLVVD